MSALRDPEWDKAVAELVAWLKPNNMQAHTRRGQTLIIQPRRKRKTNK